jgi:hypothetical protein
MGRSRLRRKYETIIDTVGVPVPFELDEFCARVAEFRGRELHLHPMRLGANSGLCGLYIELADADHVCFPADTSPMHQQHIVVHELAHLLCGHQASEPAAHLPDAVLAELFPTLDRDLVRSVLGRSRYADPAEQEAEVIASLILQHADDRSATDSDPVAAQIESALG